MRNIKITDPDLIKLMNHIESLRTLQVDLTRESEELHQRQHRIGAMIEGSLAQMMNELDYVYGVKEPDPGYSWHIDVKDNVLRKKRHPHHYGPYGGLIFGGGLTEGDDWKRANREEDENDYIDFEDDGVEAKKREWRKKFDKIDWRDNDKKNDS